MNRKSVFVSALLFSALSTLPALSEAGPHQIHLTAQVVQIGSVGDPANPQLGDWYVNVADLLDDAGNKVGTGSAHCTNVSIPPRDTLFQCMLTVTLADGDIILGGVAPAPAPGAQATFGILGGTGKYSKARGISPQVVTAPGVIDVILSLN